MNCRSLSISETSATGTRSTVVATRVNRSNASSGGESRSDVRRSASRRASFLRISTSLSFKREPSLGGFHLELSRAPMNLPRTQIPGHGHLLEREARVPTLPTQLPSPLQLRVGRGAVGKLEHAGA